MSASIDSNPSGILPARQPLIFTFSTDTTITDAFRFVVQVFENDSEIGKYYLAPNENDVAHFDLSELVRDRVEVDDANHTGTNTTMGDTTTFYTRSTTGVKKYQVRVGEWNGPSESLDDDNTTLYLIGGAEQKSSGLHPDFSQFYATGNTRKGWLTDYPSGTYIELQARDEDEGRLAFIAKDTWSDATAVAYAITNTTTTYAVYVPISSSYGGLVPSTTSLAGYLQYVAALPASIDGLTGLDFPGGSPLAVDLTNWISYTVTLVDLLIPKSQSLRVTRDCSGKTGTQIAWSNSRGGWDYMTFEGKRLDTTTSEAKPYNKPLGDWGAATYTFNEWSAETKYYHKSAEQRYQLSGIFNEDQMQAIRSLFLSRKAFIRLDKWLPVVTDESQIQIRELQHKIYQVSFNVKLAQAIVC